MWEDCESNVLKNVLVSKIYNKVESLDKNI